MARDPADGIPGVQSADLERWAEDAEPVAFGSAGGLGRLWAWRYLVLYQKYRERKRGDK